jgi:hypothetical protein
MVLARITYVISLCAPEEEQEAYLSGALQDRIHGYRSGRVTVVVIAPESTLFEVL